MNKRIYKYPLELAAGDQVVEMQQVAKIIHVHEQDDRPVLWAEVLVPGLTTQRKFVVYATGDEVRSDAQYLGTIHIGWTVWHVYEVMRRESVPDYGGTD